jgi:hypothetical protein
VIDHAERTCIDKITKFDLLNPKTPEKAPEPIPRVRKVYEDIMKDRQAAIEELMAVCTIRLPQVEATCEAVHGFDIAGAVRTRVEQLAHIEELEKLSDETKKNHPDVFCAIPHISELPMDVYCRIQLREVDKTIATRSYSCPRKYREAWKTLLQEHLDAGRIRPSSSSHASPAFIIPKADPNVLPRWVNDYRQLNLNTVHDRFPLPRVDDILADCGRGRIWSKMDMTNSFFQTRVHPDDVGKTAVSTPFGLYDWLVMPMGLKNAPAVQQRRLTAALREHIGRICHVYLDDIVIWSDTLDEHKIHVGLVLEALRKHKLYANLKKSKFFVYELEFLGHKISRRGIEACDNKAAKILDWPVPRSVSDVRAFLGLVRYIASFLPKLATYTRVLNPLTSKFAEKCFPEWTERHQEAFEAIKELVVSHECLTVINHDDPGDNKIFVMCDTSDYSTGAVLSWGESWETARPVAFDSGPLKDAELNYPVHEKELLAIIRALKKW